MEQNSSIDDKIHHYRNSYDFLFELTDRFNVEVFENASFNESKIIESVRFNFVKYTDNGVLSRSEKLNNLIAKKQYDVYLIQGFRYLRASRYLRKKVKKGLFIAQFHAEMPSNFFLKRLGQKILHRHVDRYIFTASEQHESWVKANIIDKNKSVLFQPELSTRIRLIRSAPKLKHSFLWVGRLTEIKNPQLALETLAPFLLDHKQSFLTYIFQEDKLLDELKEKAMDLKITDQVYFKGYVKNENLASIYSKHQFIVNTSIHEGGSTALMEAMFCGCTPIFSNIPANISMTDQGSIGINIGQNKNLYSSIEHTPLLNENAIAFAFANFSAKAIAQKLIEFVLPKS